MAGGGEDTHVQADFGDDRLGGLAADAGDLIEAVDDGQHRGAVAPPGGGAGGAVGAGALGGGDPGDQFLDPGGELADLAGQGVDLVQQHPGQLGVMAVEPAGERLDQAVVLGPHPAAGQAGQHLRVTFAADQRLQHVADRPGIQLAGHRRDLDQGVFQQFLQPGVVPGALPGQVGPQPGVVPQLPDLRRGDKRGPQHAPLGELGQPHRIQLVAFGPARSLLHVPGPDQLHIQPGRFQQVEPDSPVTEVDSRVTFSIPSRARCSPSSRIAFVVASTGHTRARRLPARTSCGTRVHTIPAAFATSTAATRSRICSCSSSSISCGSITATISPPTSPHAITTRQKGHPRGLGPKPKV